MAGWSDVGRLALQYGVPAITGLGTGYDIYRKTGDIGKATVGGGVTAAGTWGLGKAGEALGGKAIQGLTTTFFPTATSVQLGSPMANAMRTIYGAVPLVTQATLGAVPAMAGGVAAGLTPGILGPNKDRMAGDILQKGLTAAGVTKEALYQAPSGELNLPGVPDLSRYGGDSYQDVAKLTSTPRAAALASRIAAEQELQNSKLILPYMAGLTQQVKDADLLRQLAARQQSVRQDTGARSMLQAQLGAQQLAQQGNQAVLQAAAQRGGYV